MMLRIHLLFLFPEHFNTGINQHHPEHGQNPDETLHQRGSGENKGEAHHNGSDNPPEQHPVVVFPVYAEAEENHDHDKNIVNGQRLFYEIAAQVFHTQCFAV